MFHVLLPNHIRIHYTTLRLRAHIYVYAHGRVYVYAYADAYAIITSILNHK